MVDPDEDTAWLVTEVESGDRRRALLVVRRKLAQALALSVGRDAATIAKELRAVVVELESLPDGKEVSAVDSIISEAAAVRDELADARQRRASGL